jgi:hypothetical protein
VRGTSVLESTLRNHAGGIVLIAYDELVIDQANIQIVTPVSIPNDVSRQELNTLDLNANVYNAGEGGIPVTTRFVVDSMRTISEDFQTHLQQRVRAEFGSQGESGFLSIIHYADNHFQSFNNLGNVARLNGGSDHVLETPAVDQRAILNTQPKADGGEPGLFARNKDGNFKREFILENNVLQTDVVIRRSLDYFLFSNGQAETVEQIIDHNSHFQDVGGVKTLGESFAGIIIPAPDPIKPPVPVIRVVQELIQTPTQIEQRAVEFPVLQRNEIEVAIYRVNYTDSNGDGQVDAVELPDYDEAIAKIDRDSKITIQARDGSSPTPGEIDEQKAELLNKPDQPSGAYSIIRRGAEGTEEVLDVFGIRDWPEETQESMGTADIEGEKEIQVPKLEQFNPEANDNLNELQIPTPPSKRPESDASSFNLQSVPNSESDYQSPRFAEGCAMLGTLWVLRAAKYRERNNNDQSTSKSTQSARPQLPELDHSARRSRKLRRLLGEAGES